MASRVFVVQEPLERSRDSGEIIRKFDISPAKEYGDLIYILDWSTMRTEDLGEISQYVRDKLNNFSITADDFLLPTGDPTAMMIVAAIAMDICGSVKIMKWNRKKHYEIVQINGHN